MKSKLLLESWRNFLKEENKVLHEGQYDIGLVPMSAKPFHEGHMSLIRKASDECKNVIVYVSTSDRKRKGELPVLGEDMFYIWENIIQKYLPENCSCVYGGSPVANVYKKLEEESPEGTSTYAIYTGEEDKTRYQTKYYIDIIDRVEIRTLSRGEDTMQISGTLMRSYLENPHEDKFLFFEGLPKEFSENDKEEIFKILTRRTS